MDELIFINTPLKKCITREVNKLYYSNIRPGNRLRHKLHNIIEGIFFMCRTGIPINYCNYKNIPGSLWVISFR